MMDFEFSNAHKVINGEEVCFTDLLNTILAFIKMIIKGEFKELSNIL